MQSGVLLLSPGQRIVQPRLHGVRGGHLLVDFYALNWLSAVNSSLPEYAEPHLPRRHLLLRGLYAHRRSHLHALPVPHSKPHRNAVKLWNPEEHNVCAGDVDVPARNVLLGARNSKHQPGLHPVL